MEAQPARGALLLRHALVRRVGYRPLQVGLVVDNQNRARRTDNLPDTAVYNGSGYCTISRLAVCAGDEHHIVWSALAYFILIHLSGTWHNCR